LAQFLRLPDATVDLTTWNHWAVPKLGKNALPEGDDSGPVLVTVEYEVAPENVEDFLNAVYRYGPIRRRDGAMQWGIFRDVAQPDHYLETFLVNSWAEHLRQHERGTVADRALEEELDRYVHGTPKVRHLVSPEGE
jgi:hypothetical protein